MILFFPAPLIVLICVLSAVAGGVFSFFFFRGRGKSVKSIDDMKPGPKKDIIVGLRDNAPEFAELYEPLYLLACGNVSRKDAVFDAWKSSNSLPPNSRYSLPPNWAMRSLMCCDCILTYFSLSKPNFAIISLLPAFNKIIPAVSDGNNA